MHLQDLKDAIRNSLAPLCHHAMEGEFNSYHTTMKYVGSSERSFVKYYKCTVCGGFKTSDKQELK